MRCSNCGKDVPFSGNVCPYCHVDKSGDQREQVFGIVFAVVGAFIGWAIHGAIAAFIGLIMGAIFGLIVAHLATS